MLKNVVTTYAARLAAILSTFLLVPIVSAGLGLDDFGIYAMITAIGILLSQDLGMASATIRFVAAAHELADETRLQKVVAASLVFFTTFGVLACVATVIALASSLATTDTPADVNIPAIVILGALNASLGLTFSYHRQVLAGVGRLDLTNAVLIGQAIVRVTGTIVVLMLIPSVESVLAMDLASTLFAGLAFWLLRRHVSPTSNFQPRAFDFAVFKSLLRFSADLLFLAIAAVVVLQSGPVITGIFLPLTAVAIYAAANRAFLLVREGASSLSTALLPIASANAARGSTLASATLYVEGTRMANAGMLTLLVPVAVFAAPLLVAWVGPEYSAAAPAAQILIFSLLVANNHAIAIPVLTGLGLIRRYAILHCIWAASGIALSSLLSLKFGTEGVAAGLVAPIVLLEYFYVKYALRVLGVAGRKFIVRSVLTPLMVATVPTIVLFVLSGALSSSIISIGASIGTWLVTVSLFNWFVLVRRDARNAMYQRLRQLRRNLKGGTP